jgi:oligopeptide transport system substrate-binding protein
VIRNALAVTVLMLALGGCARDTRQPCVVASPCLFAGVGADPTSLDPALAETATDDAVLGDLTVGLTTLDAAGRPIPGVAKAWTVSRDGRVWRFVLRPARWSDGTPLTASDFVYSLRRLEAPQTASPYAHLGYVLAGAEAVNHGRAPPQALGVSASAPDRLDLRLVHPTPYLPALLAHFSMAPTPAHVIARFGRGWTAPGRYVSDGPFRLADWRLGDRLTLVRNPWFYDARHVALAEVDDLPTTDPIAAERRVARGELDLNTGFAANRIQRLRRNPATRALVRVAPYLDSWWLVFNRATPGLGDVRVRRALSLALDRGFITGALLRCGERPSYSVVPADTAGRAPQPAPAWADLPLAVRQAQARALLSAAGFGPGRPLRLRLNVSTSTLPALAADIQADWRAVGVDARIEAADSQIFFADLNRRDFDAALQDWTADYDDPTTFLDLFRSDAGPQNRADLRDFDYDAILDRAAQDADPSRRSALLAAAEQRLQADAPVAPLYVGVSHNLVGPRVRGFVDNPTNQHRRRWMALAPTGPIAPGAKPS